MGDYTEAFLRAHLKAETPEPLITWLDRLANDDDFFAPYDEHPFFTERADDWKDMFFAAHACYQIARPFRFQRAITSHEQHELICHVSAKYVPVTEFLEWIAPWLDHLPGAFLGYTLSEFARPSDHAYGWNEACRLNLEEPTLIHMPDRRKP